MSAVIDRSSLGEIAYQQLLLEFVTAFSEGPESTVLTPAWGQSRATVAEVVNDNFSAKDGEDALHELLRVVRNAARGVDVKVQARAWIDNEAKRFATWHESDRVAELMGEDE
jgi:hypothetical protein